MGEEPNGLRKYFCDSSCQNSIHIMYLGQVSLNTRKFKEQQFMEHSTGLQCVYTSSEFIPRLLWARLFLHDLDVDGRC